MDGSGNVFADLGLPNPEQELVKASLTLRIHRIIRQRGLTQKEAAVLLGVKQPQVSLLIRNRSGNFSMSRLIDFLTALGQDVQIAVPPHYAQGTRRGIGHPARLRKKAEPTAALSRSSTHKLT